MPRFLGIDGNVFTGSISMTGTKTATVMFKNSSGASVSFNRAPRIGLTLTSLSTTPPVKTSNIKNGNLFVGFTIGFQNSVTLDVEWSAQERA